MNIKTAARAAATFVAKNRSFVMIESLMIAGASMMVADLSTTTEQIGLNQLLSLVFLVSLIVALPLMLAIENLKDERRAIAKELEAEMVARHRNALIARIEAEHNRELLEENERMVNLTH